MGRIEENKEAIESLLSNNKDSNKHFLFFITYILIDISKSLAILADKAETGIRD